MDSTVSGTYKCASARRIAAEKVLRVVALVLLEVEGGDITSFAVGKVAGVRFVAMDTRPSYSEGDCVRIKC